MARTVKARAIRPPDFRVVELIQLIQDRRYPSVRQIAERFECSVRTAERYIGKVRDLVAEDLVYPRLPKLRLSEGEAAAMFLAAKLLYQCRGTPYEEAVTRALAKLSYLFAGKISRRMGGLHLGQLRDGRRRLEAGSSGDLHHLPEREGVLGLGDGGGWGGLRPTGLRSQKGDPG